jgi:hypothetical protein
MSLLTTPYNRVVPETKNSSDGQEIQRLLRYPKTHYPVQRSTALSPNLNQMRSVPALPHSLLTNEVL